jgi:hypothetical protein
LFVLDCSVFNLQGCVNAACTLIFKRLSRGDLVIIPLGGVCRQAFSSFCINHLYLSHCNVYNCIFQIKALKMCAFSLLLRRITTKQRAPGTGNPLTCKALCPKIRFLHFLIHTQFLTRAF